MSLRFARMLIAMLALAPGLPPGAAPATPDDAPAEASEGDGGRKSTWLLGHARTGRNRWVTGATVLATPTSGEPRIYVTATDEKGSYFFETLPEGRYDVTITKGGLAPVTKDGVELRFPFRAVVEVVMEPGATPAGPAAAEAPASGDATSLEGTVRARAGQPLDEVRIRLIRADGSVDPRDGMTGAEGTFTMPGLQAGDWRLEVLGAGFLPIRVPVTLSGEATLTALLVEQPASYEPPPLDLMPPEMPIPPPPPPPATDAVAEHPSAAGGS